MTAFLDTHQQAELARDLDTIARLYAELLRIARRETSPPGGKAARNPNGYASRPPVNLSAMSTTIEVQTILAGWSEYLRDDRGIQLPDAVDVPALAGHLADHLAQIAACDWAPDMAYEVEHWARIVDGFTTEQPEWKDARLETQDRADIITGAADAFLRADEIIELHFHLTGRRLSERTLRSWRGDRFPARRIGGTAVYWYPEVRQAETRRAASA